MTCRIRGKVSQPRLLEDRQPNPTIHCGLAQPTAAQPEEDRPSFNVTSLLSHALSMSTQRLSGRWSLADGPAPRSRFWFFQPEFSLSLFQVVPDRYPAAGKVNLRPV